jgi:hypothetical protein
VCSRPWRRRMKVSDESSSTSHVRASTYSRETARFLWAVKSPKNVAAQRRQRGQTIATESCPREHVETRPTCKASCSVQAPVMLHRIRWRTRQSIRGRERIGVIAFAEGPTSASVGGSSFADLASAVPRLHFLLWSLGRKAIFFLDPTYSMDKTCRRLCIATLSLLGCSILAFRQATSLAARREDCSASAFHLQLKGQAMLLS